MTWDTDLGLLQKQLSRYRMLYLVAFNNERWLASLTLYYSVSKKSHSKYHNQHYTTNFKYIDFQHWYKSKYRHAPIFTYFI